MIIATLGGQCNDLPIDSDVTMTVTEVFYSDLLIIS